ncbi:HPF/RaiA family ribosome-associated protein [Myxococcaceae bacterium GXIMD 01537]
MKRALQVTFRGMETSEALSEHIHQEAGKLEQFFDGIVGCHVVVEEPHRHKQQGRHFHVRVDLHVPGKEIVVGRDTEEHRAHEDAYVAVSDAFDNARRQLQHYAEGLRAHR